jgi:hypothetical protein
LEALRAGELPVASLVSRSAVGPATLVKATLAKLGEVAGAALLPGQAETARAAMAATPAMARPARAEERAKRARARLELPGLAASH